MYHLWEVLLKYWFIRILGCLSTVLIWGREHRQGSEKPIGNLFSCLHRYPQTQQTFESSILWWFHAWYRLCKQGSRFPHQKGIYSLLTQLQLSLLWSHFLQRKSKVVSDNWILLLVFLHQTHPQNIVSCLLLYLKLSPISQAPIQDTDVTSPCPFLHFEPLAHTASMWWVSFFLQ